MTLKIGDKLPSFRGVTADGPITHRDLKGKATILYFYPKDATPGCTTEACDFRDALPRLTRAGAQVFGVSRDSLASHEKFSRKHELPFPLISDEDGSICAAFDTWVEKSMYGKKYMGVERATFLIDAEGVVQQIWRQVKVKGHVEEVLSAIKNIVKSK